MFETWAYKKLVRQHPGLEAPSRLGGDDAASRLLRGLLPFVTHLDAPQGPLALARPLSCHAAQPAVARGLAVGPRCPPRGPPSPAR